MHVSCMLVCIQDYFRARVPGIGTRDRVVLVFDVGKRGHMMWNRTGGERMAGREGLDVDEFSVLSFPFLFCFGGSVRSENGGERRGGSCR